MVKCFKCEQEIKAAVKPTEGESEDYNCWECPCGVHFRGGGNFGSTLYDSMMDNIVVELIVCDDCLQKHKSLTRDVDISPKVRRRKPM